MIFLWITLGLLAFSAVFTLTVSYICYRMAFLNPRTQEKRGEEFPIPEGEIYEPYRAQMVKWMKEVRAMPHKEFEVTSFDGLKLCGNYYEYAEDAPIELMFHGYKGSGERDLCGGVQRCFKLHRNVLIVDQRASGKSEGKVITFGINESRDCLTWIDFILKEFGKDARIILTGISMGAATVMMTAGKELPKNVICVLADCGYTSPKEIIQKVIKDMNLPPRLAYPFVKLGAKIYGRFNLQETSALDAMKKCKVPVIFIHGEDDAYVPCEMSRRLYDLCKSPKVLITVPKAGHGLAYLVDMEGYFNALTDFSQKHNIQ